MPFLFFDLILAGFLVLLLVLLALLFVFLPISLFIFLLGSPLVDIVHLLDAIIEGLFMETGIVLEVDSHEAAEARDFEIVDTLVAYHLLHQDIVGELLDGLFGLSLGFLFRVFRNRLRFRILFDLRPIKDIKRDSLSFHQVFVDYVFVAFGCIAIEDVRFLVFVFVSFVIIGVFD